MGDFFLHWINYSDIIYVFKMEKGVLYEGNRCKPGKQKISGIYY